MAAARLTARPRQPRPRRARRYPQRRRDLLRAELRPGIQQEHFTLIAAELRQRRRQPRRQQRGHHPPVGGLRAVRGVRLRDQPGVQREPMLLGAPVVAAQVRRDPVQPRTQRAARRIETRARR
jgi:hypothetical protein